MPLLYLSAIIPLCGSHFHQESTHSLSEGSPCPALPDYHHPCAHPLWTFNQWVCLCGGHTHTHTFMSHTHATLRSTLSHTPTFNSIRHLCEHHAHKWQPGHRHHPSARQVGALMCSLSTSLSCPSLAFSVPGCPYVGWAGQEPLPSPPNLPLSPRQMKKLKPKWLGGPRVHI